MSYGGDGARDPLQQPPHRLDSASPPLKRWDDQSPDEYRAVYTAVDRLVADRYRDYKIKAHNHLKAHGPSRPYGEMYAKDWETQQTQIASSGALLDKRAIAKEVLEEQRSPVRGVGRVPNGTSSSLDSTTASKVPQGTSHRFSGDPRNNDPQFAMYEAQLCRMQQKIELLKNSITVVVPEEDDNEDADEGFGDV
ncbi:hypothetical protein Adt_11328 [Abeliophyllum distichum]|uniref:Uncharacterized protein n=1 Tax=Abeliophyllum distichum TaxID=126358 RepID=A0ABD1UMI9_9LAMI